jgi:hypothetical protein
MRFVKFGRDEDLRELGFDAAAIKEIFLGRDRPDWRVELLDGASAAAQWFAKREQRASGRMLDALVDEAFEVPDPWNGQPVRSTYGIAAKERGALPYDIVPIFYKFISGDGREFWLTSYGTTGRVTQLYIPQQDCMIYDINDQIAEAVYQVLQNTISSAPLSQSLGASVLRKKVGIVDLIQNFGHQLINNLSSIQHAVEFGLTDKLDEIWILGSEFFGPTERLFPQLAPKIRKYSDRWLATSDINSPDVLPVKMGANFFPEGLRNRIICEANARYRGGKSELRRPIVAVTVRAAGRCCVNLPEIVQQLVERLLPEYPDLGIIIDGYVIPEDRVPFSSNIAAVVLNGYDRPLRAELEMAADICNRLPDGVVVDNLIGCSMMDSIVRMQHANAYVAHVGTLQHKLGFFLNAPGVIHGPKAQLSEREGGAFQAEHGHPPIFLPEDDVADEPSSTSRGAGFVDYRITNIDRLIEHTRGALRRSF